MLLKSGDSGVAIGNGHGSDRDHSPRNEPAPSSSHPAVYAVTQFESESWFFLVSNLILPSGSSESFGVSISNTNLPVYRPPVVREGDVDLETS